MIVELTRKEMPLSNDVFVTSGSKNIFSSDQAVCIIIIIFFFFQI